MKNKKVFIITILIIIIALAFAYFSFFNKAKNTENDKGFFEQMISIENYELMKSQDYEKLTNNFKPYCNDRGLDIVFSNREIKHNYNFIEKYNIKSYNNLEIELLKETENEGILHRDYKITYIYMDNNNKEYEMADYYNISIKESKIDYAKLNTTKSSVGK